MVTHFSDDYQHAATLKENGLLDLSETPECAVCRKEDRKCLLCAACKAVFYCSTECAKTGWNDRVLEQGGVGQKTMLKECLLCGLINEEQLRATNSCVNRIWYKSSRLAGIGTALTRTFCGRQNQMAKGPALREMLEQFPWARVEKDGTFRPRIVLASRGILGTGKDYGFWTEEPCCDEHGLTSYEWGTALLQPDHPDERAGWKLPDEEIPWLVFDEKHRPPSFPPRFEDWRSYYDWRGLPMSSPAALLLHWPLTVYQLLRKLKLVLNPATKGERHKLLIHYVGVEEELDYLPIFGELALLLPHTDIELILFGEPAYMVFHSAPQITSSPSIISKSENDVAYTYTAPKENGSGTVRIALWGGGPTWTPETMKFEAPIPDAIIALNAGLGAFQEWQSVIVSSRAFKIPFAITDFMEASLELNKSIIHAITVELPEEAEEWMKMTYGEKGAVNLRQVYEMPSETNPFMKPGQKLSGGWSLLPAAVNGFTFVVTPSVKNFTSE